MDTSSRSGRPSLATLAATLLVAACADSSNDLHCIEVAPGVGSIAMGTTQGFTATGVYENGARVDFTSTVLWGSTTTAVATVADGTATGLSLGTTTILATDPATGVQGGARLTVTDAELVSLAITPPSPQIALGTDVQLTAMGTFTDMTVQDLTGGLTWTSSDSMVATVATGLAQSAGVGTTTITATDPGTGIDATVDLDVTNAVLTSIAVTPADPSIALGTNQPMVATGTFSDSTVQDLTTSVTWSSSLTGVATVDGAGLASSVAVGATTITATDPGTGIDGSTSLTVTAAELVSIAVTPADPSIALGTDQQFVATGTYTDMSVQDVTASVLWSSSTPATAAISNALGSEGLASSVAVGVTTITATDAGSGIDGSTSLTVTAAELVSIAVTPATPSIALGLDQQFVATGTYTDASNQDLTTAVTWTSSTPATATISNAGGSEGLASSATVGVTTITATDSGTGIDGTTTLTVTAAELVSIAVTPAAPSIALGLDQQFVATGTYTDASNADLTTSVTWSSSTPATATISNAGGSEGLASSAAVGVTTITATDSGTGIDGSTTLTVTAAELVSIGVTPATPSIALGLDQQFVATGTYTDASNVDITTSVTWSSSAPATATISNAGGSEGLASSAAVGVTTITATDSGTGIDGTTTLTVTAAELVSIAVTPTTPSIALGLDQQFVATGTYTDASNADLTTSVTWSSSTPATATISNAGGSEGLASSAAVGSTTITATDSGTGIDGSTTLTVTAAELVSIAVTPATPSIALGTDQQFVATGTYTDASMVDLTTSVTWSSDTPATATISNAGGSEGLASSAAIGSTTITATDSGTGIDDSTTLTVTAAELVSIAVTPATPSIALGLDQQFVATGTYTDASNQDLTTTVTWSSSTPATATISNAGGSEGLASSAAVGVTTITATDSGTGIDGSTTLTVTAAALVSIAITPVNPTITDGSSENFTATGTFTDASMVDLTTSVTWSSSAPAVATISNAGGSEGLATAASVGATTITATHVGTGIDDTTTLSVIADIAIVAADTASSAAALDLDVPVPAGTAEGDVMVASIAIRPSSATITPPAGWTLVRRLDNGGGAANSLAVYTRIAASGEPATHRWSFSASTGSAGAIASFRAADQTAPVDVEAGASTASALTHDAPSVTTTVPRTMLVTAYGFSSSATWTPPAGMTECADVASLVPDQATGIALGVAYELQVAAGATGARTATASSNADAGNTHAIALTPGP